jgi:hypothetical protein
MRSSVAPKNDSEGAIQLPKEVLEEVRLLHMDAVAILHFGNRFFSTALLGGKHEILGTLPVEAAQRLHNILQVVLGFALRHMYVCSRPHTEFIRVL